MNFGILALMLFAVIGAAIGVYVIAAGTPSTPFVDSAGNTTGAQANASQLVVANNTAPIAGAVGGGIVLIVVILIVVFIVGGIIAYSGSRGGSSFRSNYR